MKRVTSKPVFMTVITAAFVLAISLTAFAQPPNDDFDNAIIVTEPLPFTDAQDTTLATAAADDPDCIGSGTAHTVWYSYTPTQSGRIQANTFGSDYDTTLSVFIGSRGALSSIACNDDFGGLQSRVVFDAVAGETYFFMVDSFALSPGGNLVFTVDVGPPPFAIDLVVNPVASVAPKTGVVLLSGTVSCNQPSSSIVIQGTLTQQVGRLLPLGTFFVGVGCDATTPAPWTAAVVSQSGAAFAAGRAKLSATAFGSNFDFSEFALDQENIAVQLRGGR